MARYLKAKWLPLECSRDKELREFPALKSMFLSRAQCGIVDSERLSGAMVSI